MSNGAHGASCGTAAVPRGWVCDVQLRVVSLSMDDLCRGSIYVVVSSVEG